ARNLWLELVRGHDGWTVIARDDGCGTPHIDRGNGLAGLRERIAELGGALEIESAPGRGFTLRASVVEGAVS
ncbi:MAG: sensor histidine kinase, partial [Kofleriaceae bacterium]